MICKYQKGKNILFNIHCFTKLDMHAENCDYDIITDKK